MYDILSFNRLKTNDIEKLPICLKIVNKWKLPNNPRFFQLSSWWYLYHTIQHYAAFIRPVVAGNQMNDSHKSGTQHVHLKQTAHSTVVHNGHFDVSVSHGMYRYSQ